MQRRTIARDTLLTDFNLSVIWMSWRQQKVTLSVAPLFFNEESGNEEVNIISKFEQTWRLRILES